jgi:hypothetical protein
MLRSGTIQKQARRIEQKCVYIKININFKLKKLFVLYPILIDPSVRWILLFCNNLSQ